MAKKCVNPLDIPQTDSSIDADDVEISSGEEEQISLSSSEILKTPPNAAPSSDSLSETAEKTTAVKPTKKDVHDSRKKRASDVTPAKHMHVKRVKVSEDYDKKSGEDSKKTNPQRLWSEDSEISLLQGMIDFEAETGKTPFENMNGFYDIGKKFVSFDVSKIQFTDKIRSLKRKYIGNDKKKPKESSFTKPHDKKCLGLAKYIWGSDGFARDSAAVKSLVKSKQVEKKKNKKLALEEEDKKVMGSDGIVFESDDVKVDQVVNLERDTESSNWFNKSFLVQSFVSLGANEYSVKEKWSKVPIEKKKIMEEKVKSVEAKEHELLMEKADILKEVMCVMSEAN